MCLPTKFFTYLEERIAYHLQRKRRTPDQLTDNYKILLVGDGWVHRSDEDNPTVKQINQGLKSANLEDRNFAEARQKSLKLENRGYKDHQVYTIDHTLTQLPDLTSDIGEVKDDLPQDYFDFVYFEGFSLPSNKETQDALNAVLPSLKSNGLILFYTPKPNSSIILMAVGRNYPRKVRQNSHLHKRFYQSQLNWHGVPTARRNTPNQ